MLLPSLSRLALIQVHNTGVGTYDVLNEDERRYWIEKVVNNINEFDNAPEYIRTTTAKMAKKKRRIFSGMFASKKVCGACLSSPFVSLF